MVVCAMVCAGASVLWVRSYSGTDLVQFVRVDDRPCAVTIRHLSAFSTRGRIGVGDRILSATQGGPWTLEQLRGVNRGWQFSRLHFAKVLPAGRWGFWSNSQV